MHSLAVRTPPLGARLPQVIIEHTATYLPPQDIATLLCVDKQTQIAFDQKNIWKHQSRVLKLPASRSRLSPKQFVIQHAEDKQRLEGMANDWKTPTDQLRSLGGYLTILSNPNLHYLQDIILIDIEKLLPFSGTKQAHLVYYLPPLMNSQKYRSLRGKCLQALAQFTYDTKEIEYVLEKMQNKPMAIVRILAKTLKDGSAESIKSIQDRFIEIAKTNPHSYQEYNNAAVAALIPVVQDATVYEPLIQLALSTNITNPLGSSVIGTLAHGVENKRIQECLITLLSSHKEELRAAATKALGKIGDHPSLTLRLIKSASSNFCFTEIRAAAFEALTKCLCDEKIQDFFISTLKEDPDAYSCAHIAKALSGIARDEKVQAALIHALTEHKFGYVRIAAAKALTQVAENKKVQAALIRTLKTDASLNVRVAAVEALTKAAHNKEVQALLIKVLKTNKLKAIRVAAVNALASAVREKKIQRILIKALETNPDWPVRIAVVKALAPEVRDEQIQKVLFAILRKDLFVSVRAAAAKALAGASDNKKIRKVLFRAVRSKKGILSKSAAYALGGN